MKKEQWQNTYDGTDRRVGRTTTAWVIEALMPLLPRPVPSPTCVKRGHDWTEDIHPLHKNAAVRACRRCMRRGLLVMETESQDSREDLERRYKQALAKKKRLAAERRAADEEAKQLRAELQATA